MRRLLVTACLMLACSIPAHSQDIRYQGSGYWGVETSLRAPFECLGGFGINVTGATSEHFSFGVSYLELNKTFEAPRDNVVYRPNRSSALNASNQWIGSLRTVTPWIAYRGAGVNGLELTYHAGIEQTWCSDDSRTPDTKSTQSVTCGIVASYRAWVEPNRAMEPFLGLRLRMHVYDVRDSWATTNRLSMPFGCRVVVGGPSRQQLALILAGEMYKTQFGFRVGAAYTIPRRKTSASRPAATDADG